MLRGMAIGRFGRWQAYAIVLAAIRKILKAISHEEISLTSMRAFDSVLV